MQKSIRHHLLQVLLLGVLPVGIFAAGLLYLLWSGQQQAREQSQIKASQTLALAVDASLDSVIRRLRMLATLPIDSQEEQARLYHQARLALESSPDVENFSLSDAQGRQIFNLYEPLGKALPDVSALEHLREVIASGRPFVSNVFLSEIDDEAIVSVGVPVLREGKVAYVVSARLKIESHNAIVRGNGVPHGGRVAIFDRNGRTVASTLEQQRKFGVPSPFFLNTLKNSDLGILRYLAPDGEQAVTAWSKTNAGWKVALRLPAAVASGEFIRYFAGLALAWVVTLGMGILFALRKARRVSESLTALKQRAMQIDHPAAAAELPLTASGVLEVDRAAQALDHARRELIVARSDREAALRKEIEAREAAERASAAKDEFLAMLGHEFRTPMAAITSSAQVLSMKNAPPAQLQLAGDVIRRQAAVLKRMVDDLLDVGRLMAGKVRMVLEPMALDRALQAICDRLEATGEFRAHRLVRDLAPVSVNADATRIEQIVGNLISNALRHTPAGGEIRVRTAVRDGQALLEVSDTGPGIRLEDRERLFELFYQGPQPANRPNSGLGIGLTLVRRLAELHRGSVSVHSEGGGATFVVSLPLAETTEPRADGGERARRTTSLAPIDILLVEDNADARASMETLLRLWGHQVQSASSGSEALERLEHFPARLVLIDIGLPGMDGYELCGGVRKRWPRLHCVALTGYGQQSDVRRALEAGFDGHLTKPAAIEALQAVIAGVQRDPA